MTMTAEATLCADCGVQLGAPHKPLPQDCVLAHVAHTGQREVGSLLCRRHGHWLDNTLTQIETLFALLDEVIEPGAGGDGRAGKTIHSAAPGRVTVMALTDRRPASLGALFRDDTANNSSLFWRDDPDAIPNVPAVLESWLRLIDEERDSTLPLPFRHATYAATAHGGIDEAANLVGWSIPFTTTARLLRRERRRIAQREWVGDYAADLADLHLALARGVGDSMWPRSIGKCPNCPAKLYPTRGVDEVTCTRCKSSWEGVALVRLRLILEQEAG